MNIAHFRQKIIQLFGGFVTVGNQGAECDGIFVMDKLDTLLQMAGMGFEIHVDVVVQAFEPAGGNQSAGIVVGNLFAGLVGQSLLAYFYLADFLAAVYQLVIQRHVFGYACFLFRNLSVEVS